MQRPEPRRRPRPAPVSILTGPEGPMQHSRQQHGRQPRFNPHRPRRADATTASSTTGRCSRSFNPHRPRRADATQRRAVLLVHEPGFNPHRPRRADATQGRLALGRQLLAVSILTGPEGPMQRTPRCRPRPCRCFNPHRPRRADATLRAPGPAGGGVFQSSPAPKGRCNSVFVPAPSPRHLFQSSPAPKGRCNERAGMEIVWQCEFQSSPAPKGRCNARPAPTPAACACFNPHRPRRADATRLGAAFDWIKKFQSSPAPKGRCNDADIDLRQVRQPVSILTGPEGPMQH